MIEYVRIPLPRPTLPDRAHPCPDCLGRGVTGEWHLMYRLDAVLVLDTLCPNCRGCGADRHDQCTPGAHHDDEPTPAPGACPGCAGRRWQPVPCVAPGTGATSTLRLPCRCVEDQAVPVDSVEVECA